MDERRSRVFDDLRDLFEGDLVFDEVDLAAYRVDSSPYEHDPLGAVAPRHERDLIALLRYATENSLALHPRGAGTSGGGLTSGPGLVVDMSRHFRALHIDDDFVIADAGVVVREINARLAPIGRRLAIEPHRPESGTIGGALASDSVGPRSLSFGPATAQLLALRCVFANGEAADLQCADTGAAEGTTSAHVLDLARRIDVMCARHESLRRGRPWHEHSPTRGYQLNDRALGSPAMLARALVGSAGSLAIVTEATLRTVATTDTASAVIAGFARLSDAAEAVSSCLMSRPSSCELYDGRSIRLAREVDPLFREALSETAAAVLIVAFEGARGTGVADRARRLADRLVHGEMLVHEPKEVYERDVVTRLIDLRQLVDFRAARGRGARRPVALWETLVVPVHALSSFFVRLQALLKREDVAALLDANAGIGRVRLRPLLDLDDPRDRDKVPVLADAVRELADQVGGTADPGHGPHRSAWMRRFQGDLVNLTREIKYTFDPMGLLNPGSVAAMEGPEPATALRPGTSDASINAIVETPQTDTMVLRWPDRSRAAHVSACNNCGACRSNEPTLRMCPVFRATRDESASPRAKVNLMRQVAAGAIDPRTWASDQFREHADQCVHCKLCETECPSGVDVSSLMLEAKAAYVAYHGLTPEDWMLSRIDLWSEWAPRLPRLFDAMNGLRWSRRILERAFGLARHRALPQAARRSFLNRAERMGLTVPNPHAPGPRAVYFLDIFANNFDPELAEATVAVLRHLGVNVYVPKHQRGCGMPALATGDLDRARELLTANLRILGNAVRDGYTVIFTEPTALLVFRKEAARLTENLDAPLVAENARDAGQYVLGLLERADAPRPSNPVPSHVGYHQPCHLRALDIGTPGLRLLRAIPGLEATFVDQGCSGMAGIYGLSRRHFRASLRAGRPLRTRLRDPALQIGSTECSACRMQMEQGTSKRTVHPMKLLALGFGLMPELRRHLTEPKPRRHMSK